MSPESADAEEKEEVRLKHDTTLGGERSSVLQVRRRVSFDEEKGGDLPLAASWQFVKEHFLFQAGAVWYREIWSIWYDTVGMFVVCLAKARRDPRWTVHRTLTPGRMPTLRQIDDYSEASLQAPFPNIFP